MDIKKAQNVSREKDRCFKPTEPKQNYNSKYNSEMIEKEKKQKEET